MVSQIPRVHPPKKLRSKHCHEVWPRTYILGTFSSSLWQHRTYYFGPLPEGASLALRTDLGQTILRCSRTFQRSLRHDPNPFGPGQSTAQARIASESFKDERADCPGSLNIDEQDDGHFGVLSIEANRTPERLESPSWISTPRQDDISVCKDGSSID
jgi:hypothetical protein